MALTLGAYTACISNQTLGQALDTLKKMGLSGAEVNVGGFIPSPHAPVESLLASQTAREEYLGVFEEKGMKLAGFNTSGNPLSPYKGTGQKHANDLKAAIKLAGLLGVEEIVCMSGLPGSDESAKYPNWVVNPWDNVYMEIKQYQRSVAIPFWKEMDQRAQDAGVKLALELHPHNLVFSPNGFLNFAEDIDAKNVGVNMDPSHLMWQGLDIVQATKYLGEHIFHVHAKDTAIEPGVRVKGVLDAEFGYVPESAPDEQKYPTGPASWCSVWPQDPAWRFVALGLGRNHAGVEHNVDWWAAFLREIAAINPDMNVNIEHEDKAYGPLEGLKIGADTLLAANRKL
ncbi:sugar phosphate isomerase/epimerase family protein [Gleimia hominis]|uniref:sugar phosphate isomerase/epimerase family protein n=1 Tax=Gleimia hominis TaxID=595468 RepID=UPI000C80CEB2|nr:sugar phosphate isomerase/epimerase [Gleimia hominis]WIK64127.1 sugar phosphate isomerase/epimerase [Gleimia hominis]